MASTANSSSNVAFSAMAVAASSKAAAVAVAASSAASMAGSSASPSFLASNVEDNRLTRAEDAENNFAEASTAPRSIEERQKSVEPELQLRDKAMAAGAAAVLSAIIVNPLDVAKTRLQAQAAGVLYGSHHNSSLSSNIGRNRAEYKGTFDVVLRVARQEGVLRLWRGTNAALLIAVPSVGIYLPMYDILRYWLETTPDGQLPAVGPFAPLVAGSLSRSMAVICCSPLELARTRIQAHGGATLGVEVPGIGTILRDAWNSTKVGSQFSVGRVRSLWTGVGAHLARDVPFSAICWGTLEPTRQYLLGMAGPDPSLGQVLGSNFAAGMMAGAFAAAITTPLDVAKTRRQIEMDPIKGARMGTLSTLSHIYRELGVNGLFVGVSARAGRAGPSIATIAALYEGCKFVLNK